MSAVYWATPVTLSNPSVRRADTPTARGAPSAGLIYSRLPSSVLVTYGMLHAARRFRAAYSLSPHVSGTNSSSGCISRVLTPWS